MIVEGMLDNYVVGDQVADAGEYRLYLCKQEKTGRRCLLQIAAETSQNGPLSRSSYLLQELKRLADELEAEYEKVRTDPKVLLNYGLGFPELVDSFSCQPQGGRWINILAFRKIEDVTKMVPLRNITVRDRRRVDLRTSAWILGKSLKLLVFAHSQGIAVGRLDDANILIEPDQHYVVFYDWSKAHLYPENVPAEIAGTEISQVAKAIITLLGGDLERRLFPDNNEYTAFLLDLADENLREAKRAHAKFYELIDGLWRREFYPFTSFPLNS
ncbi:MAG: hypothetical protein WC528_00835 [Patescibacteria group bacterium]